MIKEDFLRGFDKEYVFYDSESEFFFTFKDGGLLEYTEGDDKDVSLAKWRFFEKKQLVEIYIKEESKKIFYKFQKIKDNENIVLIDGICLVKINDEEIEKRKVSLGRSVLESKEETKKDKGIANVITGFFFLLSFLFILLIGYQISFLSNAGFFYIGSISFVINVFLLNIIKKISNSFYFKYGNKIKNIFYG